MSHRLNSVNIVLVETTHPGNIGAAARAMKTMSQDRLTLVKPKLFPSAEATARAAGADDILVNADVVQDIKTAITDCSLVITTSARSRSLSWPMLTPRECAKKIIEAGVGNTAIIFGRESSGLRNDEIELGHYILKIPTNDQYCSLNLASAVQIICYELLVESLGKEKVESSDDMYVTQDKMELFYQQLEECMTEIGYHDPGNPKKLMHRMRRLFNRALLENSELNILRGFLTSVQEKFNNT